MSNSAVELIRIGLVLPRSPATWRSMRALRSASPSVGRRPRAESIVAFASGESFITASASETVQIGGSLACWCRTMAIASLTERSTHLASRSSASSAGGSTSSGEVGGDAGSAVAACVAGASGSTGGVRSSTRLPQPQVATSTSRATARNRRQSRPRSGTDWPGYGGMGISWRGKTTMLRGRKRRGQLPRRPGQPGNRWPSFSRLVAR